MGTVERNIEHYILVGKHNEGVQKNPPHQKHQKGQGAEVEFLFIRQMGTQRHRRHERHDVHKEDNISDKRIRKRASQDHLIQRPQGQVGRPQQAAQRHQAPKQPNLAAGRNRVRQHEQEGKKQQ